MPDGRTMDYAVWRACERFRLCPPGVEEKWNDNNVVAQAMLLSYDQIRQIEEDKRAAAFAGVRM